MFLVESKKNFNTDANNPSNMVDLLEAIHENEVQMNNATVAMIRLEHEAIITENAELLQEGIADFFKKAKDAIVKFFKMIKDFIVKMYNKAVTFVKGLFAKKAAPPAEASKKLKALKAGAVLTAIIASVVAGKSIYKKFFDKSAITALKSYLADCNSCASKIAQATTEEEIESAVNSHEKKWEAYSHLTFTKISGADLTAADVSTSGLAEHVENPEKDIKELTDSTTKSMETGESVALKSIKEEDKLSASKTGKIRHIYSQANVVFNKCMAAMVAIKTKAAAAAAKAASAKDEPAKDEPAKGKPVKESILDKYMI